MLFNSLDFAIFLPIVFIIYWVFANKKNLYQNLIILIASYIFYSWWDYRFLSLIIFSTIVDYLIGLKLSDEKKAFRRKLLLWTSIGINLGLLCYFKYFNFFIDNFVAAFSFFGTELSIQSLNIILPVGISFYTFQTLSYTIDIYQKKLKPTKDFIAFAAFVSFFPQLVAGPIERASNLLPQIHSKRYFSSELARAGIYQILWGLFKKVVIADNCAILVDEIFAVEDTSGSMALLGGIFFAFQIYGDFSGYSDIAIGVSKLFGIKLMTNFAYPYFSRDIAEFWRRWHISLSTWFRDYLYIPIGGSRGGTFMKIRNVFIIFIVSGFWHGASWTFIIWGALNAIYFLPLLLTNKNRKNIEIAATNRTLPYFTEVFQILFTFSITVVAWIFFRAVSLSQAFNFISKIFSESIFSIPRFTGLDNTNALIALFLILFLLIIEWFNRNNEFVFEKMNNSSLIKQIALLSSLIISFHLFRPGISGEFIYFQF